jgi:exosortase
MLAGGLPAARGAALPLALLALAIPLPAVERLAPPLAGAVAHWAALAAGSMGTAVVQVGAQLVVGGGTFAVGAPCSGLRSIVALGTLAVIIAGAVDGPHRGRVAVIALALPLALAANWLRLTGLLWLAGISGPQPALSAFHAASSPLLVLAATGALLVVANRLGCHVRT